MKRTQTAAARMRTTARRSSPISAYAVGDRPWATAPQFSIRSVDVDQLTVEPGSEVTVTASYGSDFQMIPTFLDIDTDHPDHCSYGGLGFTPGADLYLEIRGATATTTDGGCWDVANNSSATETATVAAPTDTGPFTIEVALVGRNTRQDYDTATIEIQVDEDAPPNPVTPDPPDDGDNGDNGGGGIPIINPPGDDDGGGNPLDPTDGLFNDSTLIAMVAVVAGVFALAVS